MHICIYVYLHVNANLMVYHISFSHVSLKSIQEGFKFDKQMCSLRNMSVLAQSMLVTRKYRCLGTFYLSTT